MPRAGIYYTDTSPVEIANLEAETLTVSSIGVSTLTSTNGIFTSISAVRINSTNINVGVITSNSGIFTSVNSTNMVVGIITANSGIITASNLSIGLSTSINSPSSNNQLRFYLLSNTQLTVSVRGSDGIVRTGIVSLA